MFSRQGFQACAGSRSKNHPFHLIPPPLQRLLTISELPGARQKPGCKSGFFASTKGFHTEGGAAQSLLSRRVRLSPVSADRRRPPCRLFHA
jgi:hypothetical protein